MPASFPGPGLTTSAPHPIWLDLNATLAARRWSVTLNRIRAGPGFQARSRLTERWGGSTAAAAAPVKVTWFRRLAAGCDTAPLYFSLSLNN